MAEAPRRGLRRVHTEGDAPDPPAIGALALSVGELALDPETRMDQDSGIPLEELRRRQILAEEGQGLASRPRTVAHTSGDGGVGSAAATDAHSAPSQGP